MHPTDIRGARAPAFGDSADLAGRDDSGGFAYHAGGVVRENPDAHRLLFQLDTTVVVALSKQGERFVNGQSERIAKSAAKAPLSALARGVRTSTEHRVVLSADVRYRIARKAVDMPTGPSMAVTVDWNHQGTWCVQLPEPRVRVECDTLSDAIRLAQVYAARRPPCEIVVRDAYHRVLQRESLDDGASNRSGGGEAVRAAGHASRNELPCPAPRGALRGRWVRRPISRRRT